MSEAQQATNIQQSALLLRLTRRTLGNSRKVPNSQISVDAEPEMIRVSKHLLMLPEYDRIKHHDAETDRWLNARSLHMPFRASVRLIPIPSVEEVDFYLQRAQATRNELIEELVSAYAIGVQYAQQRLKSLFDPHEYFDIARADWKEQLRREFSMEYDFLTFNVPDQLARIAPEVFVREKEKAVSMWAEATEEVRMVLRQELHDLVTRMHNQLTGTTESGRPRVIQQRALDGILQWCAMFQEGRDLTQDVEIQDICTKLKEALQGVDTKTLKEENIREYVGTQFERIGQHLESLVEEKPGRRYFLPSNNGDEQNA